MIIRPLNTSETMEALSRDWRHVCAISELMFGEVGPHEWDQFPTKPHLRSVLPARRHDGVFLVPGYAPELMKAGIAMDFRD